MTDVKKDRHPVPLPQIAACMITKNSSKTITSALDSIRPFVDEVCVYDTGSTDETVELLQRLNNDRFLVLDRESGERETRQSEPGELSEAQIALPLAPIKVKQGSWRNDFGWAREQSFKMISAEANWLIWLDDDDVIENAQALKHLAYSAAPELDGYVFFYDYARDEAGNNVCQLWRERLMRKDSGYQWKGAVHEVLVPPDGHEPRLVMIPPNVCRYIHNRPPDRYAPNRNLEILLADVRKSEKRGEEPNPRTLAYVGTEQMAQGNFLEAAPWLERYLAHKDSGGWSDERMQVMHKLATCLRVVGNVQGALEVEHAAMNERWDWGETYVGLCESYAMTGDWAAVEHYAELALKRGMPQSMLILNPLEFTLLPSLRLVEAAAHQGRYAEAANWLALAEKDAPGHPLIAERQAAFEKMRQEGETIEAVLKLRETLIRHDENLKALQVVENAPYMIQDHPAIVAARSQSREMCAHYLHPEEYTRWYAEEPKESTYPWSELDRVPELFPRVQGLLDGLKEQEEALGRKPRVLDLGCNDWAIVGAVLHRHGYACDGVELNKASYERALELAREERALCTDPEQPYLGVHIVQGDLHDAKELLHDEYELNSLERVNDGLEYDAISIFEVLEHVPDVNKALAVAESLLRPGGRVYLSTPNGAYERGNLPDWNRVERKGHLRATPALELAELISERGRIEDMRLHAGDPSDPRLTFLSYEPRPSKGTIVFYAGAGWEPWSPRSMREGGLGGSETALVQVASRLGMAGYKVKVYSGAEPGLSAGALWKPFDSWDPTEECDLLVVSRLVHVFDNPVAAKRTALWCHDHSYPNELTEKRAAKIDSIVVLSEWQKARFARLYPFAKQKLQIIRNGIGMLDPLSGEDRYAAHRANGFAKRKPRCVYSSSADRGLDSLLEIWPELRKRVPKAELHVFYGWDVFDRVAQMNPSLLAYKQHVFALAEKAGGEKGGIHFRGRIGQLELAKEMGEARVWTYPTAFLETSCIGAMEARAAGLPLVSSDLGALKESVGPHGQLIPWPVEEDEPYNRSPEYREAFLDATERLLTEPGFWQQWQERATRGIDTLDWSLRVSGWEALLAPGTVEAHELLAVAA